MPFPDWGNVPSWLGAGSLLLAFRIFVRDRANADRSQVDRMGAWAKTEYERRAPENPERLETCKIHLYARNATDLPMEIRQLVYEVSTRWYVLDPEQSATTGPNQTPGPPYASAPKDGTRTELGFIEHIPLAPQDGWNESYEVHIGNMAPAGSNQLEWFRGVTCTIKWLLIVDNAGRRWEVRPAQGKRARRVGRRWRPAEYQPRQW